MYVHAYTNTWQTTSRCLENIPATVALSQLRHVQLGVLHVPDPDQEPNQSPSCFPYRLHVQLPSCNANKWEPSKRSTCSVQYQAGEIILSQALESAHTFTSSDIPVNYSCSVHPTILVSQDLVTMCFGKYFLVMSLNKGKLFCEILVLVEFDLCPSLTHPPTPPPPCLLHCSMMDFVFVKISCVSSLILEWTVEINT